MGFLTRGTVVLVAVATLAGCGSETRVTAADKDKISGAALGISVECISNPEDADVSSVEDSVTDLLDARDKLGDQRFTLSKTLTDVTVQDIIDNRAKLMDRGGCVPDQAKRLR